MVENLRFTGSSRRNEMLVEDIEDILADFGKFTLNLLPVALDHLNLSLVAFRLLLLLNR
jgi:hypothetical protein